MAVVRSVRPAGLTDREVDVLRLAAQWLTYAQIGRRLFIAEDTVRTHARNLREKLGVHRTVEAVQRGRELGLLPARAAVVADVDAVRAAVELIRPGGWWVPGARARFVAAAVRLVEAGMAVEEAVAVLAQAYEAAVDNEAARPGAGRGRRG